MLAVALSIASSISWGIADFGGGVTSRRVQALVVVLLSQGAGLIFALTAWPLWHEHAMPSGDVALAIAGGAAGAIGLLGFYSAMAVGKISIVTPIAGMGVVVPVAWGLLHGESPAAIQLAGLVVAIAAVTLVSYEPDASQRRVELRSVLLAVVAALGFGTFFVLVDSAASSDTASTVVLVRVGGVAVAGAAVAAMRTSFAGARQAAPVLVGIGFFDVFANALFAIASTKGALSVVAVGGSLYPAVTTMLAFVFLHERLTRTRQFGVAMALVGIVMIAAGT